MCVRLKRSAGSILLAAAGSFAAFELQLGAAPCAACALPPLNDFACSILARIAAFARSRAPIFAAAAQPIAVNPSTKLLAALKKMDKPFLTL